MRTMAETKSKKMIAPSSDAPANAGAQAIDTSPDVIPPGGDTPAMRQYLRFKREHPECVLFFRMGDFYEMFWEDAKLANKVLGVTLTQRSEGVPMAGVPYHAVEGYLRRMIQAGHRVAVCEQMEDPAQAKGVVRRDVTRVITPGTLTDESLLDEGRENPLAAVMFLAEGAGGASAKAGASPSVAVAWAELSTGAFQVATFAADVLADELARIAPRELLYVETADGLTPSRIKSLAQSLSCATASRPGWQFRPSQAVETLREHFGVASLAGFGIDESDPALAPAAAILHYLLETQKLAINTGEASGAVRADSASTVTSGTRKLSHLRPPRKFERSQHLIVDQTSLRSLEVERTLRSGGTDGSLLNVLLSEHGCVTAMGKRTLRHWLCFPLRERSAIEERQRVVGALVDDARFLDELRAALEAVQDVQRILARIAVGRASPRDLVALGTSASQAERLRETLAQRPSVKAYHARAESVAAALAELAKRITAACVEAPPPHLREGGLIRDGYDAQLDEFRTLQRDSSEWLARYQKQLIDTTSIPSLKVGFNKIFGYYIELTASQRDKMKEEGDAFKGWARKQTLKNAERFITPELKEFEGKVLTANERSVAREGELFFQLCTLAQDRSADLQAFADLAAELDALACLARRAVRRRYVKPAIVDEPVLRIKAGRHPVLDELLGDRFVANDVELGGRLAPGAKNPGVVDEATNRSDAARVPATEVAGAGAPSSVSPDSSASLALITGPNMAGKSTYIRQAALITLLAHTGSFVPAEEATVGLCDRIFTRIGASDELHAGASTFMVEMTETANICHHASPQSLVILDEIGRGTSTLDGLSLAWAIAEHLAGRACRALFATHYHELTTLADPQTGHANVCNLHVTVREWQDQIVFLHRIAPGSTDRSYGIHVAKIAGLPPEVVRRANELLGQLAVSHEGAQAVNQLVSNGNAAKKNVASGTAVAPRDAQMSLFTEYLDHPAVEALRKIDLNALTPLEAFDRLRKLKEQAERTQR